MQVELFQKPAKYAYQPNATASDVVKPLQKNSRIIGLTMGHFSLIDLIHEILKKIGGGDVVIATWSAGIKDVNNIAWMVSTDMIKNLLLITDHSYVNRQKKYALQIAELFAPENIRTSEIHAKFVVISNANWKISIRTSMNLNANKTCETYEIEEGEESFNFYYNFAMSIAKEMPKGFTADGSVVDLALNRAWNSLSNPYGWQTDD